MYEDHSVEEKYLYNFSSKEKIEFSCQQRAWRTAMNSYMVSLNTLINLDSNAIFGDFEPEPNTFLEIRYVLNRIAANDIRDTIFEVSDVDNVRKANKLALQVARSFQKNTVCKKIILHKVGLTDRDMLPVLRVLRHKELDLLDISGNKKTDRTLDVLKAILVDPNTHCKGIHTPTPVSARLPSPGI